MILKLLKTYNNHWEASIDASYLNSFGIETFLDDVNINVNFQHLSSAMGGIKLKVNEDDFQQATDILEKKADEDKKQSEYIPVDKFKGKCPFCESDNFTYSRFSKGALILSMFFLGLPLLWSDKKGYCYNCQKRWKVNNTVERVITIIIVSTLITGLTLLIIS